VDGAEARWVTVTDGQDGQRLDNFLLRLARGVPKSHVYRIVRSGEVRVNKGRARADQRLLIGDVVRIPPMRVALPHAARAREPSPVGTLPVVVFEDEHLLVVDKPAGLAAHGGSGIAHGLIERMRAARPYQPFLELAHRLDRETSGLLLMAKSRRSLLGLHEALRDGQIDKRYFALVLGDWHNDRQHVKAPLHKYLTAEGERRVRVDPDAGMPAHTVFTLQQRFGNFTLLEATLLTGRTHQIRVHLAHLGFPIAGDDKYGDFTANRALSRGEGTSVRFARMFLHAHALDLQHPVTSELLAFRVPLPDDCGALLRALSHA